MTSGSEDSSSNRMILAVTATITLGVVLLALATQAQAIMKAHMEATPTTPIVMRMLYTCCSCTQGGNFSNASKHKTYDDNNKNKLASRFNR